LDELLDFNLVFIQTLKFEFCINQILWLHRESTWHNWLLKLNFKLSIIMFFNTESVYLSIYLMILHLIEMMLWEFNTQEMYR